jgi:hypothetical protein
MTLCGGHNLPPPAQSQDDLPPLASDKDTGQLSNQSQGVSSPLLLSLSDDCTDKTGFLPIFVDSGLRTRRLHSAAPSMVETTLTLKGDSFGLLAEDLPPDIPLPPELAAAPASLIHQSNPFPATEATSSTCRDSFLITFHKNWPKNLVWCKPMWGKNL